VFANVTRRLDVIFSRNGTSGKRRWLDLTYKLNDKQFDLVWHLPIEKRYEHLVKRVSDWRELWSLQDSEQRWVLAADDQGRELFPIWPHPRYAEALAVDNWAGSVPARISLQEWLAKFTPALREDQRLVAVFPTDDPAGAAIEPESFAADMRAYVKENY
jgi:hypothetical protein